MAEQKLDDQLEHTYSSYGKIRDVVQKTCQRRWTIGKSGERGSGISVRVAWHDDDDDDDIYTVFSSGKWFNLWAKQFRVTWSMNGKLRGEIFALL